RRSDGRYFVVYCQKRIVDRLVLSELLPAYTKADLFPPKPFFSALRLGGCCSVTPDICYKNSICRSQLGNRRQYYIARRCRRFLFRFGYGNYFICGICSRCTALYRAITVAITLG